MKITGQVITIPIDNLVPNPWNPNKQTDFMFDHELHSIKKFGFIDPVTARRLKGSSFEIIDGEHRWRAAKQLGFKEISINNLGKVEDADAEQLTLILNELKGTADRDLVAELLQRIKKHVPLEEMIKNLPMAESEMHSLLANAEIDWERVKPTLPTAPPEKPSKQEDGANISHSVSQAVFKAFEKAMDKIAKKTGDEDPEDGIKLMCEIVMACNIEDFLQGKTKIRKSARHIKK